MYRLLLFYVLPVNLAGVLRTPPMGWMSWQTFRCETDCGAFPDTCISENLYRTQADLLVSEGYAAAGYTGVHLDDCVVDKNGRAFLVGNLRPDPSRFPNGFKALGDYLHAKNLKFGFYTAISAHTCAGAPGSAYHEEQDAKDMASWGVDYLKADGCGDTNYYTEGYSKMGNALQATGRDIIFSCSWPAYLASDEYLKQNVFKRMTADGCSLWRNFNDIGPTSGSARGILEHFGKYSHLLAQWAGPGQFHDPDVLTVGIDSISDDMARTQMALYCIMMAPLIMGNDLRKVKPSQRAILLNRHAIAVNQDPLAHMGERLAKDAPWNAFIQVWYRPLANGDVAVALYNAGPAPKHVWGSKCNNWNRNQAGYWAPAGPQPDSWCSSALGPQDFEGYCCNTEDCAGYKYSATTRVGCMFKDVDGGFVNDPSFSGAMKKGFQKPSGSPLDITVNFADIGIGRPFDVVVFDIWAEKVIATANVSFTYVNVPWQGTAFLRLSQGQSAASADL